MIFWLALLALPYLTRRVAKVSGDNVGGFMRFPRVNWRKTMALAKKYGPAIASMTPAGPAVAAGMQLANAARAGDPAALAKVAAVQAAASNGDPKATETLNALMAAKLVREHVKAAS